MKPNGESPFIPNEHQMEFNVLAPYTQTRIRVIRLRRKGNVPLGFSIRGGCEHGTGIFVSDIQAGTEAERQGLKVGDQIVRINGFNIDRAIHEEVLGLLKSKPGVVLKVKSVGMIPVKDKKKDPLTWKMIDACKNSPNGSVIGSNSYSGSSNFEEFCEKSVLISDIGAAGIGCTIVKGPPDLPGIFVQTVKPNGLAEQSGLHVGDHIIDVNGVPFFEIDFKEAVAWMKSSKDLRMTVRKGAGLDLFPEEKARRVAAILNGVSHITRQEEPTSSSASTDTVATQDIDDNKNGTNGTNGTNGHHEIDPKRDINHNQKDCVDSGNESQQHNRQDSVSTIATNATSSPSFTTTTGSEREYCISEAEEAIAQPVIMPNEETSSDVTDRKAVSSTGTLSAEELKKEEEWLIRERKNLEEEQRKLKKEAEKLAEERKKLEEDMKRQSTSQVNGITPPPPMMMIPLSFPSVGPATPALTKSFLAELQQKQLNPISNGDARHSRTGSEVEKYQEEIVKRQQHEKLMQEFQQMHKRMFGTQNGEFKPRSEPKPIPTVSELCDITPAPSTENVTQSKVFLKKTNPPPPSQCFTLNHNRRQRNSEASFPPPPPPGIPRTLSQPNLDSHKLDDDNLGEPEVFEITKDELDENNLASMEEPRAQPLSRRGSLYVPPLSTNPHMFVDPTTVKATQPISVDLRRQTLVASKPLMVPPTQSTGSASATSAPISIPSRVNGATVAVTPSSPPTSMVMGSPLASCSPPVSPNVRQVNGKDVPITDSRGPAPKPPQTYFDRPVKGPLVTIGVYPDTSRSNRFTFHESVANANGRGGCMHPALRHRQLESISSSPTSTLSSASGGQSNKPSFSVSMTSSNSLNSSNASSTTSSPLPQQKQPSINKEAKDISVKVNVNSISVNKSKEVLNPFPPVSNGNNHVPKMTAASLNGKVNGVNGTNNKDAKTNGTNGVKDVKNGNGVADPKGQTLKKSDKFDPLKIFTEEQIEGREVKIIEVKKTGTLNMKVEGGINSDLNGKVLVSEVWPGGCIPNSAGVFRGDQILMVNDRKLINVSLTLANAVLRDAMANNKETLRLVIAKEIRNKN